jgi:hypothetical protein
MTQNEALRLALEALEKLFGIESDVAVWRLGGSYRAQQAITAIKAALEAKDEPYALEASMFSNDRVKVDPVTGNVSIGTPQRTWVGLTDKDLKLLSAEWRIVYGAWMDDFAKDIEAKLKEKNT